MWRIALLVTTTGFLLESAAPLGASDRTVFSGPQPEETLSPLKVLVAGNESNVQTVDLASMANKKPFLFVFVHKVTRPSSALRRTLMNYAEMRHDEGLVAGTIYLTDDPSQSSRFLSRRDNGLTATGVSPDGAEGPGSYGLNRNVETTVLVGQDGKVTSNFALVQSSVTDAPKVITAITELMGGRVPSPQEIEFLSLNQYAAEKFRADGAAPKDPALRRRICDVLRAMNEPEALEAAAKSVNDYVAGDAKRQSELGEAARVLLHSRYKGTAAIAGESPAGKRMHEWAERFGAAKDPTSAEKR